MYQAATEALKQIHSMMADGKYGGPGVFWLEAEDGRRYNLADPCGIYVPLDDWRLIDASGKVIHPKDAPLVTVETTTDSTGSVYA